MSKARDLANFMSTGGELADGQISVSEINDLTATAAELNALDGITSTVAELNLLDGVTASTAEINKLDGLTASTSDLNGVAGINSNVQTQLNLKSPIASPTFTGTATIPTASITTLNIGGSNVTSNISGLGTASQLNVGTSANNIPQLDGNAKLPAGVGSQLTGISAGTSISKAYYLATAI
jgi:hypothetical protein